MTHLALIGAISTLMSATSQASVAEPVCWADRFGASYSGSSTTPENPSWVTATTLIESEMAQGFFDPSEFECSWVRLTGEIRVGLNSASLVSFVDTVSDLQKDPVGNSYLTPDLKIMSFQGEPPEIADLDGAQVELIGYFQNMCRAAYAETDEYQRAHPDLIVWTSGRCHSNVTARLELSDVRIVSVLNPAGRRIVGEANRAVAGDLDPANLPEAEQEALIAAATQVLLSAPTLETDPESDSISRLSFHLSVADSPLNRFISAPEGHAVEVYSPRRDPADSQDFPEEDFTICFCMEEQCEDRWPLTAADALMLNAPYVCQRLERDETGEVTPR